MPRRMLDDEPPNAAADWLQLACWGVLAYSWYSVITHVIRMKKFGYRMEYSVQ